MKRTKALIATSTTLAVGIVALLTYVTAKPMFRSFPQPHPLCSVNAEVEMSNGITATSNGTMSMFITGNSEDGVARQTLRPVSFQSSGDHPMLGHIEWTLADRPADLTPETVITSNQADDLFPATCDIYFYVRATCSNQPDVIYESTTPVHMRSTNLMSFNPHVNELYTMVDPVDFQPITGQADGGFTVTRLTSVLN